MTEPQRVVVTGLGAVSGLGEGVDALWHGLLEGRAGVGHVAALVRAGTRTTLGGATPLHDHPARDRALAAGAIASALDQARLEPHDTAFVWSAGLDTIDPQSGVHRPAGACFGAVARAHRRPRRMLAMACASGTATLGEAFHLVRAGRVDAVVAGGSSAMLNEFYVTGFAALGALALNDTDGDAACRPFDVRRSGFVLADGAAALVLEPLERALARGATPLAEIVGYGCSSDAHDLNRPPQDGDGARRCVQACLADAGLAAEAIDAVSAHGTGTLAGDVAEAAALEAAFPHRPPVYGCKGALGHAMAAAGALEAVVAVRSLAEARLPPTRNLVQPDPRCDLRLVTDVPLACDVQTTLSLSCGMGGQNAAVALRRVAP